MRSSEAEARTKTKKPKASCFAAAVYDPDSTSFFEFEDVAKRVPFISQTRYLPTASDTIDVLNTERDVGILVIYCGQDEQEITDLLRAVQSYHPGIVTAVVAKPGQVRDLQNLIGTSENHIYLTKPLSNDRLWMTFETTIRDWLQTRNGGTLLVQ